MLNSVLVTGLWTLPEFIYSLSATCCGMDYFVPFTDKKKKTGLAKMSLALGHIVASS